MKRSYNGGNWTEARFKSFITSALRTATQRWPPKFETLREGYVEKKINEKTGKLAMHYRCNACKALFPSKGIQVDHIQPVVDPKKGFVSWDVYVDRLFCEKEKLQLLCKECHKEKTALEKTQRKKKNV